MMASFIAKRLIILLCTLTPCEKCWSMEKDCASVLPQVESEFKDIYGKLSLDDAAQLQLIRECAKRSPLCVIADSPNGKGYISLEGKSRLERVFENANAYTAASAFGSIKNKYHGKVCALIRYSGGTATAWVTDAWYLNKKKIERIDTDNVNVQGEVFSPEGLLEMLYKSVYSLH